MRSVPTGQMRGCERPVGRCSRQGRPLDLDHRHVDFSGSVEALAPEAFAVAVQRNGKPGGSGHVVRIDVQLDFDPVREVLARLVYHHVPARHQKQPLVALEEEAAGIRQRALVLEGLYPSAREKERVYRGWPRVHENGRGPPAVCPFEVALSRCRCTPIVAGAGAAVRALAYGPLALVPDNHDLAG
jgi:hypothetical protein